MFIGIAGKRKSGKTTLTEHLMTQFNASHQSFAEPLKIGLQALFHFSDAQLYGTRIEKETPDERWFNTSPRTIMQFIGTDLLRDQLHKIMPELEQDIFIRSFDLRYQTMNETMLIFDDLRFQNEVDYIHEKGGIIIQLLRDANQSDQYDKHASEQMLFENIDFVIDNNVLSLEETKQRVTAIVNAIINS